MKKALLASIASLLFVQTVHAAELSCTVTRTNRRNADDVATHQVNKTFDVSQRQGWLITAGQIRSFLIPETAEIRYSFEIMSRNLDTRLALATYVADSGELVDHKESYGSPAGSPDGVSNSFVAGRYSFEIDCYLNNN